MVEVTPQKATYLTGAEIARIAEWFKSVRSQQGLSQKDLSGTLGIPLNTISRIESRYFNEYMAYPMPSVEALSRHIGVSLRQLQRWLSLPDGDKAKAPKGMAQSGR